MLLNHAKDEKYWCLAAEEFPRAYNSTLHSAIGTTPYQAWYGEPLSIDNLQVWGADVYLTTHDEKVKPNVQKSDFVGFTATSRIVKY